MTGNPSRLLVSDVIAATVKASGLTAAVLLGRNCARYTVSPWRQAAFAVMRKHCKASYPAIGAVFDRDHTTVMYGAARARADFQHAIREIEAQFPKSLALSWHGALSEMPVEWARVHH